MKHRAHRVLLIDDDLDEQFLSHRALRRILSDRSSIHLANSGDDAIAYLLGEGRFSDRAAFPFPSIILTDLNMSNGDGFNVLEFLQSNPEWSVVPKIVFTSSDDEDDVRTAFSLGASAYHLKSHTNGDLEECIRGILEYWTGSLTPPVDGTGRLLITKSVGRRGARYPQRKGATKMLRPKAARAKP